MDMPNRQRLPGQAYLWLAVILFGSASPVVRKIVELGAQFPERNAVSLCNVLFVGNICALPVFLLIYRKQWTLNTLQQLPRRAWGVLLVVAILGGALAPSLLFQALSLAQVSSVLFVSRIETPILLALSVWLLGERLNARQLLGGLVCSVGALIPLLLPGGNTQSFRMADLIQVGTGEALAVLAAVTVAVATILSKRFLTAVPAGVYLVLRTGVGAGVFFSAALWLYGPPHFADVLSPLLWQWMLAYGSLFVALAQLCWFTGLRRATVLDAALAGSFVPAVGAVGAYFLLGEMPTGLQLVSGGLVLVGLLLCQGLNKLPWPRFGPGVNL